MDTESLHASDRPTVEIERNIVAKKLASELLLPPSDGEDVEDLTYEKIVYEKGLIEISSALSSSVVHEDELHSFVDCVNKINKTLNSRLVNSASSICSIIRLASNLETAKKLTELLEYWDEVENERVELGLMNSVPATQKGDFFYKLFDKVQSPKEIKLADEQARQTIEVFLGFLEASDKLPKQISDTTNNEFKKGISECCFENENVGSAKELLWIYDQINKQIDLPPHIIQSFALAVNSYAINIRLDHETAKLFVSNLLFAMTNSVENVAFLCTYNSDNHKFRSKGRGLFAVSEYICHLYSGNASPQLINELLLINREIPTSISHRYEQNRLDGERLEEQADLQKLRQLIHTQKRGLHGALSVMVDYYDGKLSEYQFRERIHDCIDTVELVDDQLIEMKTYDMSISERIDGVLKNVKVIDVIRRLKENTNPMPDHPPICRNLELTNVLRKLGKVSELTEVNALNLEEALRYVNDILEEMYTNKVTGIDSTLISALAFLDRATALKLRSLEFEEQVRVYRSSWFAEVLRFHDLTTSPAGFDKTATNDFISKVESQEHPDDAFKIVGNKILLDINSLGVKYRKIGFKRWGGMLWSGNLSQELELLMNIREPRTRAGERYKALAFDREKSLSAGE